MKKQLKPYGVRTAVLSRKLFLIVNVFLLLIVTTSAQAIGPENIRNTKSSSGDVLNHEPALSKKTSTTKQQNTSTLTGTINDTKGEPIVGATVVVKGTTNGTTTDVNGNYTLNDVSEGDELVFSFVGMNRKELTYTGQSSIDVVLSENTIGLDEVVAIGYGTVKKRELTGSVASIKSENFNEGGITNAMELLQGKIAGLSITRTNGGDPTKGFEIRLRGASSISAGEEPLVVIDGIPGGDYNAIAPGDVESIDILKDGSAAAIYGTRGTNGVILITTKKGEKGNVKVEYTSKISTQSILKRTDVLSSSEYREMKNTLASSGDETKASVAESMIDYGADTNWFDEIMRSNPVSHIHHLALSGGTDKSTYRTSVFYSDQEGMLLKSENQDLRMTFNLSQRALNDKLKFDIQLGLTESKGRPVNYDAYRQAIKRNPTEPVYADNGEMYEVDGWQYYNPVGLLTEVEDDERKTNYYSKLGLNYNITNGLKVTGLAGLQVNRFLGGEYTYSYARSQELDGTSGEAQRTAYQNISKTLESTIEWRKELNDHSIYLLGGYSFQETTNEGFSAENTNFISDDLLYNDIGSGTYLTGGKAEMDSYKNKNRLVAFFGRGAYNYKNKYFFSASVRREGSSKFGDNYKWGWFPAVSGAWDISEEGFIDGSPFDFLKLRVGYGVTGNQGIDPYISLTRYGQSGYYYYKGDFLPAYEPVSNPNPNLRWETKSETNIGIDWMLDGGRIGGAIDYYVRNTNDLIDRYDVPVPPNLYPTTYANVGSMQNSGFELTLNTVPVEKDDFRWTADLTFEYRNNKVISLSNDSYKLEYRNVGEIGSPGIDAWSHRYEPGEPVGNIHGYVFEEIDENGKWVFKDYNPGTGESDGEITTEDRDVIGNGIPDFYTNISTRLTYKNWDISMLFRGAFGQQIINVKDIFYSNPKFLPLNVMKKAMDTDLWDDPAFSSYYVEDGDFLKLDNLTFGYTFPGTKNKIIKDARIYFTGTNLLCFTNYSGVDPEVSFGGLEPGKDDRRDYPSTRSFTLGFKLTF